MSGAPLSQYAAYVRYAEREFSPQAYVILIVGNDFDESLCGRSQKTGIWCYAEDGTLEFLPQQKETLLRATLKKSAFVRYVYFNAGLRPSHIKISFSQIENPLSKSLQQIPKGKNRQKRSCFLTLQ